MTGFTTKEYLVQRIPVKKMAHYWLVDIFSAGFFKSPMFEKVMAHLKVGAQKKTTANRLSQCQTLTIGGTYS